MKQKGYVVKQGAVYLVEYGEPAAYSLYREALDRGSQGLCISTEHPDTVKNVMGITSGEKVWLSEGGGGRENIAQRSGESQGQDTGIRRKTRRGRDPPA